MANIIRVGGGAGGSQPTLITKSITQNGTYNASSDNADGYSSVEVDVEGSGSITPILFTDYVTQKEGNRTITVSADNIEVVSPITASTGCTGVITIPVSNISSSTVLIKYSITTPSWSSGYFSTAFFSDTQPTGPWIQQSGYGYVALTQSAVAVENLYTLIEVPTGASYFNIEFGTTNYSSIKLFNFDTSSSGDKGIEVQFNSLNTGAETFTIDKNGKYLLLCSSTYGGSHSITLPNGRTPDVTFSNDSSGKGYSGVIVDLQKDDVVTLTNTVSSWVGRNKLIAKLNNFGSFSSEIGSSYVSDGTLSSLSATGSGEALVIAMCSARVVGSNLYDQTPDYPTNPLNAMFKGGVETNTFMRIYWCDVANLPTLDMRGYDGGYAGATILQ